MKLRTILLLLATTIALGLHAQGVVKRPGKQPKKPRTETPKPKVQPKSNLTPEQMFDKGCNAYTAAEAKKWFLLSAQQGYALAQFKLGDFYYYGEGIPKNYTEAVKWYRKAADQNLAEAQFQLSFCYKHGRGVSHNPTERIRWLTQSAEQGYCTAQYVLANCYYDGEDVAQDFSEAAKWYRLASENQYPGAKERLIELQNKGY